MQQFACCPVKIAAKAVAISECKSDAEDAEDEPSGKLVNARFFLVIR